jgi:chromosomal replication initiator protein
MDLRDSANPTTDLARQSPKGAQIEPSTEDTSDLAPQIDRQLRALLGERRHTNWFQKTARLEVHGDELVVFAGSPYLQSWLQRQFRADLLQAARSVLGPSARLTLEVDAALAVTDGASPPTDPAPKTATPAPQAGQPGTQRRKLATLTDFLAGDGNRLTLTAKQVAEHPGATLNPLFLYGPVGVGKTHLMEGIYRRVRQKFPSLHVVFLTAENFANYYTQALRERSLPGFHQKFRNVDMLLIDDVDFFDGKRGIQEEFLHTLKSLESGGRQVVLTGDRHPRLLTKTSDELITRFQSGMSCRVDPPDETTRRQIVRQLVQRQPFAVAEQALDFIAGRFSSNVRELAGAVNCLQTYHSMSQQRVSLRSAREVLARLERDCIRIVRLADVERAVCRLFQITGEELKSPKRSRMVSQPRMLAMYLARRLTQSAYSEIGKYFGDRNHSTVMAAEKKVVRLIDERATIQVAANDWPVVDLVESLETHLKTGA